MKISGGWRDWAVLGLLALIWGASFLAIETAIVTMPPLTIAAIRISLGALVLFLVVKFTGRKLPDLRTNDGRRIWCFAAAVGLIGNAIPFTTLNWAQDYVTSGFAGIAMATSPLILMPIAHVFVAGEVMSLRKTIGFVTGFIGVVILIGRPDPAMASENLALARAACIGVAACYAISSVITRRAPTASIIGFATAALIVASLVLIPLALWHDGWPARQPIMALTSVIYLGMASTALATLMLVHIIRLRGPSFSSLLQFQVPVWAVIIGVVVLSEPLPGQFVGALALILAGVALARSAKA